MAPGVYAAVAASFFGNTVQLVGVVGADFPNAYTDLLRSQGIDLQGLAQIEDGKSFPMGWSLY